MVECFYESARIKTCERSCWLGHAALSPEKGVWISDFLLRLTRSFVLVVSRGFYLFWLVGDRPSVMGGR
jgi:hypothetical protein